MQAFLENDSDTVIATAGAGRGPGNSSTASRAAPHAVRSTGVSASVGAQYKTVKVPVQESMLTLLSKLHEKFSPSKSVYKPTTKLPHLEGKNTVFYRNIPSKRHPL